MMKSFRTTANGVKSPHPTFSQMRVARGAILILVLVCLAIASALLIAGVKLAFSSRQFTQLCGWKLQAEWLAESGAQRATAQLAADPNNYRGETWKIPAEELSGAEIGVVRIEVKPPGDQPRRREVSIEADFPDDPVNRARYSKEFVVEIRD